MSFTKKEVKLFDDPYFEVIREAEDYIEVISINTRHCWNVFKNTFESRRKITLYHKHKFKDSYYHKQRVCRTVAEAIETIKSHDAYVLERDNQNKKLDKINKPDRRLKVYEGSDKNYKPISQIRLQGKWLEELGFEPGTPFVVKCEPGKLTLTVE